jgi:hypothetical protein
MRFQNILFHLVLIEIAIGGGGRFTSMGDLSLRVIFFLVSIILVFFNFNTLNKEYKDYLSLSFLFVGLLILSSFVGVANNAKIELIYEDVKILSYFPMILFFCLNINSSEKIRNVISIIKISSVFLSFGYLCIYFGLESGIINAKNFYESTFDTNELVFRNDYAFLYKGFLFSLTGFFFIIFNGAKKTRADYIIGLCSVGIIFYSVFMTYTRGLIISLLVSAFLIYLSYSIVTRKMSKIVLYGFILSIAGVFLSEYIIMIFSSFSDVRGSNQEDSDLIRTIATEQVIRKVTPISFLIGQGLGIGVESRPMHMEISYMEIFHKQGILGLSFYFLLLQKILKNYFYIIKDKHQTDVVKMQSLAFTAASMFIFIQSATNPLIITPMGISMILISIVVTDFLCGKSSLMKKVIISTIPE